MQDAEDKLQRALQQPGIWLLAGDHLLAAADVLWDQIAPIIPSQAEWDAAARDDQGEPYIRVTRERVQRTVFGTLYLNPFLLLTGCAIENYLKAAIVHVVLAGTPDDAPVITMPRLLVSSHDQLALARRAGVALSADECDLLKRLTRAVVWSGRYPIPKKAQPGIGELVVSRSDRDMAYEIRERVFHLVCPDLPLYTARPLPSVRSRFVLPDDGQH